LIRINLAGDFKDFVRLKCDLAGRPARKLPPQYRDSPQRCRIARLAALTVSSANALPYRNSNIDYRWANRPLGGGIRHLRSDTMSYHFSKTLDVPFDTAIVKATEALKREGFGVLTEIDVQSTLKQKIGVDFRKYRILGACNPGLAHRALQAEDKIGTMLPCNVIVQEHADGKVEVSAIDPIASMQAVANPGLATVATEVQGKLRRVIEGL
jgi:uncharacterized protein (DUF302 family)